MHGLQTALKPTLQLLRRSNSALLILEPTPELALGRNREYVKHIHQRQHCAIVFVTAHYVSIIL